jgi:signal transduction histidine kinase
MPSLEEFRQRVHPEDRAKFTETLETGIREAANFEMEFRIVPPRSPQKHIRAIAHPVFTASGELEEFVGTVVDVTERKRAEEEHQAQLWFFESMDAINRAMQGTSHLEQMMSDVLDVVLAIFGCDRASLIYRCDSEVPSHRVRMERTRPEYIGAFGLGVEILNDAEVASAFRKVLASGSPVRFDPESKRALPSAPADKFNIKSMIAMAVFPKVDKPYIFALNQCSHARVWTPQEEKLFQEIGRRLADALDTLLMFRNLREAQRMVEASRDELRVLADEQAALRRVAMLVARGVPPDDVFTAVAEEVGRLVSIDSTAMLRYEADGTAAMIAGWTDAAVDLPVGARFPAEGENVTALVLRTERPALIEDYANATGELAARMRQTGIRSAAGAPIVVDGRLWGVIVAGSIQPEPLPAGAELRIAAFTELLGTAVANADSRAELTASRARIVTAADETRRRIERDLHDGVQQRLVSLGLELRTVQGAMPPDDQFRAQLTHTVSGLAGALEDLVEISRGIHPAILSRGGLAPALQTLARRSAVPVNLEVPAGTRLPAPVEVAAYYVVSEALTNTAKHAHASAVHVAVEARDGVLELSIRDDGSGGADPTRGSGLIGLTDRVHALGGTFEVASPVGHGTTLLVTLPVAEG